MPWELWAVVSIVAGIVIVLLGAFYIFSWRDVQARRAPVLPQPAAPVVTPAPAPAAPATEPAVDPYGYAEEIRWLDEEARELGARLTVLQRAQRNKRMLVRATRLDEATGFSESVGVTTEEPRPRRGAAPAHDEAPAPRQQPRRDADQRQPTTTRDLDAAYQRGVADRRAGVTQEVAREHAEGYPRQQGLQHAYWDGYGDRRNAAPATPQPTPAPAGQPAATAAPAQNAGAAAMAT